MSVGHRREVSFYKYSKMFCKCNCVICLHKFHLKAQTMCFSHSAFWNISCLDAVEKDCTINNGKVFIFMKIVHTWLWLILTLIIVSYRNLTVTFRCGYILAIGIHKRKSGFVFSNINGPTDWKVDAVWRDQRAMAIVYWALGYVQFFWLNLACLSTA